MHLSRSRRVKTISRWMNDSGDEGSCCTIMCLVPLVCSLQSLAMSMSIPLVLVLHPLPITSISSRATRMSPPSMYISLLPGQNSWAFMIPPLNEPLPRKIASIMSDSLILTLFAIRQIRALFPMVTDASLVK